MTLMWNIEKDASGAPIANKRVTIALVAGNQPAYSDNQLSIESVGEILTDDDGRWELDLEPNVDLVPSGTVYSALLRFRGGNYTHLFTTPDAPGLNWIGDNLSELPGNLPSGALAGHLNDTTAHLASSIVVSPVGGLVSTDGQSALAELDLELSAESASRIAAMTSEQNARIAADSILTANVSANTSAISAETVARLLADTVRVGNDQTTDYALVLSDAGKQVRINSATAKAVTVPSNSSVAFPIGTIIEINQVGAGAVSLLAGSGVTIYNAAATVSQSSSLLLRKQATNAWDTYIGPTRPDALVSAFGDQNVSGVKTYLNGLHVNDGAFGNSRGFSIQTRTALPTTPVPVFRPMATDKIIALDICPNGDVSGVVGEVAWFDVCDRDILVGDVPVATARVGARSDYIEFGSRVFGGASVKPVWLTVGGAAALKLGTDLNIDGQQDRNAVTAFRLRNATAGTAAFVELQARADVATGSLRTYSSTFSYDSGSYASVTDINNDAAGVAIVAGGASGKIRLLTGGINNANTRLTVTAAGLVQVALNLEAKRLASKGTALVAGDFALSAGWGDTATVNNISATDQGGKFWVTANGSGLAANPTVTITFKEAFPQPPVVVMTRNGGNGGTTFPTWTNTATQIIMTFPMTPLAANNYVFGFIVL